MSSWGISFPSCMSNLMLAFLKPQGQKRAKIWKTPNYLKSVASPHVINKSDFYFVTSLFKHIPTEKSAEQGASA